MTLSCKVDKVSNYKLHNCRLCRDKFGKNELVNRLLDYIDRLMLQLLSEIATKSIRIRFIRFGQLLIRVSKVISV